MTSSLFNDGWAYRRKVSAFAELGGAASEWMDVTLPHDALISVPRDPALPSGAPTAYFPGGAFEYRTELPVAAEDRGKFVALEFDGVHRDAMVYVNGALAGQRALGYSRFVVRVDPFLRFGEVNQIRVDCRTHQDSRWYTGAGIYRDVRLITKAVVHVEPGSVRISTPDIDGERAVVEVAARVRNLGPVTVTTRLTSAVDEEGLAEVASDASPVTLLPGESVTVRHRVYVERPALWSVDSPSLYSARLRLEDAGGELLDEETVTFGIRSLQVDPKRGLRINGEEVKLRGACIHHDNGPLGAATIQRAEQRRVEILKQAGFNAIRSAHNPISTALLDACDRLGMLVMDETFDVWTSSKSDFDYAFDFPEWWERDVEALVEKDFNHPSVILYSIGNEIPETGDSSGGRWSRRLAEKVRSLDETRFVTNGINGFVSVLDLVIEGMRQAASQGAGQAPPAGGVNAMMTQVADMMNQIAASEPVSSRTEESFAVLDVAGMNYGDGRYELDRVLFPNRVIVGTETFPSRIAGNWALVRANPHLLGDFVWAGWDYLGEAGIGAIAHLEPGEEVAPAAAQPYPWLVAFTGDIDITGHRRPASYYRETVFGLRSEPYIAVHRPQNYGKTVLAGAWSWSDAISSWSWDGFEGNPTRVEVYSDADEVELRVNGRVLGRAAVGEQLAFRADFDVTYEPGELVAVAYSGGLERGRAVVTTPSDSLVLTVDADRTSIRADSTDAAFLAISLTDGEGNLHSGRDRLVSVAVEGPAVLQALGSGDPATEEDFVSDSRRTFDGRALAVVRPTGEGGITVTVRADGCKPVVVPLQAGRTAPVSVVAGS